MSAMENSLITKDGNAYLKYHDHISNQFELVKLTEKQKEKYNSVMKEFINHSEREKVKLAIWFFGELHYTWHSNNKVVPDETIALGVNNGLLTKISTEEKNFYLLNSSFQDRCKRLKFNLIFLKDSNIILPTKGLTKD